MLISIARFMLLITLVTSNPINQGCQINELRDYRFPQIQGTWYCVARTKHTYKSETWKNSLLKFAFNTDTKEFQYTYMGVDSKEICHVLTPIIGTYIEGKNGGRLKIKNKNSTVEVLHRDEDEMLLAFCYDGDVSGCPPTSLDIYFLKKMNDDSVPENEIKSSLMEIAKAYCLIKETDLIFSDPSYDYDECYKNGEEANDDDESESETSSSSDDEEDDDDDLTSTNKSGESLVVTMEDSKPLEVHTSTSTELVHTSTEVKIQLDENSTVATTTINDENLVTNNETIEMKGMNSTDDTHSEQQIHEQQTEHSHEEHMEHVSGEHTETSMPSTVEHVDEQTHEEHNETLHEEHKEHSSEEHKEHSSEEHKEHSSEEHTEQPLEGHGTEEIMDMNNATTEDIYAFNELTYKEPISTGHINTTDLNENMQSNMTESVTDLNNNENDKMNETTVVTMEEMTLDETKVHHMDENQTDNSSGYVTHELLNTTAEHVDTLINETSSLVDDSTADSTETTVQTVDTDMPNGKSDMEIEEASGEAQELYTVNHEQTVATEVPDTEPRLLGSDLLEVNDTVEISQHEGETTEKSDQTDSEMHTDETTEAHTSMSEETVSEAETTTTLTTTTTTIYCPPLNCSVTECAFGRKLDSNGCETCDCMKNETSMTCTQPYCHPCYYGSVTDTYGCDTCNCKPRPEPVDGTNCPKLDCMSCNYGSVKDEYNCETCVCIIPNSFTNSDSCDHKPKCPYGDCHFGSALDEYGCPTCDCLKSNDPTKDNCQKQKCQHCPHGYFTDSYGCETCLCKPDWMDPCAKPLECNVTCTDGSYLNTDGCPTCNCIYVPTESENKNCSEIFTMDPSVVCDADGSFAPKQCDQESCFCVTKEGVKILDFSSSLEEGHYMNCACARSLHEESVNQNIGRKLYCQPNGNYERVQCVGKSCACVDEHGTPIGPSVPLNQRHNIRCEGVFQRLFYDKYFTKTSSTTLTPPLCIFHRDMANGVKEKDPHLLIPECDENGEYQQIQCDRQHRYCWCVKTDSGVEIQNTRVFGKKPDCLQQTD